MPSRVGAVDERPVVRVDVLYGDLRPYSVPFLSRLSASDRVAVTVWHGKAASGVGAPITIAEQLPVPSRTVRNIFWPRGGQRIMLQRGALRMLRSESSVVVCNEVIHNLTIWLVAWTRGWFKKRFVLSGFFYRPGAPHVFTPLMNAARRFLHRRADAFLAYTERGRAELLAEGISEDRVFVSQNTLDTEVLMATAASIEPETVVRLRAELELGDGPVLLYLGRLVPVKRVDIAIRALERIDRDCSLVIVGDGHLREELERISDGLRVRFRGAIYDETELGPYFKLADLLVLPGRVGLTCVHGFANGLPCVTTSDTVVEQSPEYDYVVNDYNGLVLASDDPDIHAAAVEDLLEDRERLDRLRKGSSETAEQLKMARMVEQFEQAILTAAGM
jgi:glycosyltransferase involved in cell wall biosynthesis